MGTPPSEAYFAPPIHTPILDLSTMIMVGAARSDSRKLEARAPVPNGVKLLRP
jgi:hypothetical protein